MVQRPAAPRRRLSARLPVRRAEQARIPVTALSGGERNRLLLAKLFAQPCNLLVLDEPTNDLDMDTLDLLQEVLGDYDGTLLIVSHDRDFLDRLVTSVIAVEGDGRVAEYAGGYTDYLRQRAVAEMRAPAPRMAVARAAAPKHGTGTAAASPAAVLQGEARAGTAAGSAWRR